MQQVEGSEEDQGESEGEGEAEGEAEGTQGAARLPAGAVRGTNGPQMRLDCRPLHLQAVLLCRAGITAGSDARSRGRAPLVAIAGAVLL